jgi:hypothetical protein
MGLSGCDGWDLFQSEETIPRDEPYVLSILSTESCPLPDGLDPKEVVIHSYKVKLLGIHPGGVPVNYFYASLLATDGERYLAGYTGCQPLLSGSPIYPGESAEGFLNFPLPPNKTPDKLVFSPELTGKPKGSPVVEISLGSSPVQEDPEGDP